MNCVLCGYVAPLSASFARADIALVYLAAAVPFGLQIAALSLRPAVRTAWALTFAAVVLIAAAAIYGSLAPVFVARTAMATGFVGTMGIAIGSRRSMPLQSPPRRWLVVSWAVALFVPLTYSLAATHSLRERGEQFLAQSRLREAAELVAMQVTIDPQSRFLNQPAPAYCSDLISRIRKLERRRRFPLTANASAEQRLSAARDWAMLNESERAIEVLEPMILTSSPDPRACQLLATIAQSREDWPESLTWFQLSEERWQNTSVPEASQGRLDSLLGIGFANRKLGRLREAEAAYTSALELAPTPAVHFLLAQFYADAQRAADAVHHANQAASIDPSYRAPAATLTDHLMTHDFGCLPVYLRRYQADGASSLGR